MRIFEVSGFQNQVYLLTKMIGYKEKESVKVVVDSHQNRVVEKEVVMNETPKRVLR